MRKDMDKALSRRDFLYRTGYSAALAGSAFLAAGVLAVASVQTGGPAFRVGWATVSITPDKPVQLAGQFHERVSTEETLYPCLATALALEGVDGAGRRAQAILVACDLVNVGREHVEEIRRRVARELPDFDVAMLSVNTTHTHTGPTLTAGVYKEPDPGVMGPLEYAPFFCDRAAKAAVQAWKARQPAALSRALGHAAVGFNRIATYADGSSQMYGNSDRADFVGLEGGDDHGLELLFLWDRQDRLSGIVVNIACPSQVVEGQRYLSADFWGPVREEVQRLYGERVWVYPMVSAAGDQSPRDLVRRGRGEPDMRSEPGMREMARRIVNGVRHAYDTAQSGRDDNPVFRHYIERLELPARRVTDAEAAEARKELTRLTASGDVQPGSYDAAMLRRARDVVERYEAQGSSATYAMDLHVLRLGDTAVATNPFELYIEYGARIRARSRAAQTLLVQLANDRGRYLPTRRAVAGGAYGSRIADNLVGPEGGDVLVEKTVAAINGMWP
ncbi:hypothetical protein [Anaerobaca lacustris]|uniref:Neutral/alkaline non-lysosomal ceramidase N-terminal domain-containing protein n=1 Tax=Anaerobaca lacustris TaxID=3044600 RepID=A0AAW6U172_9BACT|nr:hypothetical protein [Sedimentisphaerales bacterium M17dextr]